MPEIRKSDWKRGAAALALLLPLSLAACADLDDRETQLDWPLTAHHYRDTGPTFYTVNVRPGDTLSQLADRYDVSVDAIARMNGISDHDQIFAGESLRIPAGSRATRDAVYADAMSRPSSNNPYIPAPEPRRGGYPQQQARNGITTSTLPDISARNPQAQQQGKTVVASNNSTTSPTRPRNMPAWYTPQPSSTPVQQPAQPKPQPQVQQRPQPQTQTASTQTVQQQQFVPGSPRFVWPVSGHIIAEFGSTSSGERNDGINIAANAGEPIRAAATGTVTYAGNQLRGYGNLLLIKHDDGYITAYAHAQSINVQKGDRVLKGQVIGSVGQTGDVTSPQLHFEIRNGVQPVNPKPLMIASR